MGRVIEKSPAKGQGVQDGSNGVKADRGRNRFLRKFSQNLITNSGKEALTILTCLFTDLGCRKPTSEFSLPAGYRRSSLSTQPR
jgi:hypothetical protein